METKQSTRNAFGEALYDLGCQHPDVVAVSADTYKSLGMEKFAREFPSRWVDTGIAEQNMMLVSAGLAATGKVVFAGSYSAFTSMRALEQLRTFICYPGLNVKVVAALGGFSGGIEGVTHIAMEDLAMVRSVPGLTVINPADSVATVLATRAVYAWQGPVYLRIGRDASPVIFDNSYNFVIGKANFIVDCGCDLGIITSGLITVKAIQAAYRLIEEGVGVTLLEIHTLKPIDCQAVIDLARKCGAIITVEEHNLIGGLGSAVAEIIVQEYPIPVDFVAAPDRFTESGAPDELAAAYGLSVEDIIRAAGKALARKKL